MANRGIVLGIDSIENVEGEPDKSVLYLKMILRTDTEVMSGIISGVVVDWTDSNTVFIASIENQVKELASSMEVPLGNNQLLIPSFVRR